MSEDRKTRNSARDSGLEGSADRKGSAENMEQGPRLDGQAAAILARANREEGTAAQGQQFVTDPLRPSNVDFMPGILRCMSILLRLKGVIVSPQFLMAGLNGSHVTPEGCLRVARKAGLAGRILYRPRLEDIPALTLPCILLLSNDRACVLVSKKGEHIQVIFPETDNAAQNVPLEALKGEYSGYALFASVESKPDERTNAFTIARGKRWFWDVLRYYAPIYRHVALASIVTNLIAVATPLFVMNVYDRVVPNAAMETLWVLATGVLIAYIFDFALRSMRVYFVDVAGRNADVVLSSTLMNKVLSMRLDNKPESTGALANNLREFEQLRDFFSSSTLLACIDVPFLAIFIIFIGIIAGPMCLLPICAIPVLVGLGIAIQGLARRSAEASYKQSMQKNALLVEIVNGLETIKSSQAESRMQRLWEAIVGLSAKSNSESRKFNNLAVNASLLITQFVSVILVIWGVYRIEEGLMTMGALIGANILLGRTMAPLMQVASLLTRVQNSHVALKALDLLMALPSENEAEKTPLDFGMLRPSLTLEKVSFAYPKAQRLALDQVSLHIVRRCGHTPVCHLRATQPRGCPSPGRCALLRHHTGQYSPWGSHHQRSPCPARGKHCRRNGLLAQQSCRICCPGGRTGQGTLRRSASGRCPGKSPCPRSGSAYSGRAHEQHGHGLRAPFAKAPGPDSKGADTHPHNPSPEHAAPCGSSHHPEGRAHCLRRPEGCLRALPPQGPDCPPDVQRPDSQFPGAPSPGCAAHAARSARAKADAGTESPDSDKTCTGKRAGRNAAPAQNPSHTAQCDANAWNFQGKYAG